MPRTFPNRNMSQSSTDEPALSYRVIEALNASTPCRLSLEGEADTPINGVLLEWVIGGRGYVYPLIGIGEYTEDEKFAVREKLLITKAYCKLRSISEAAARKECWTNIRIMCTDDKSISLDIVCPEPVRTLKIGGQPMTRWAEELGAAMAIFARVDLTEPHVMSPRKTPAKKRSASLTHSQPSGKRRRRTATETDDSSTERSEEEAEEEEEEEVDAEGNYIDTDLQRGWVSEDDESSMYEARVFTKTPVPGTHTPPGVLHATSSSKPMGHLASSTGVHLAPGSTGRPSTSPVPHPAPSSTVPLALSSVVPTAPGAAGKGDTEHPAPNPPVVPPSQPSDQTATAQHEKTRAPTDHPVRPPVPESVSTRAPTDHPSAAPSVTSYISRAAPRIHKLYERMAAALTGHDGSGELVSASFGLVMSRYLTLLEHHVPSRSQEAASHMFVLQLILQLERKGTTADSGLMLAYQFMLRYVINHTPEDSRDETYHVLAYLVNQR